MEEVGAVEVVEGKISVPAQTMMIVKMGKVMVVDQTPGRCQHLMMEVTVVMIIVGEEDVMTTVINQTEALMTLRLMGDADVVAEMTMKTTLMLIAEMRLQMTKAVTPHLMYQAMMNRQMVEIEVAVEMRYSKATH